MYLFKAIDRHGDAKSQAVVYLQNCENKKCERFLVFQIIAVFIFGVLLGITICRFLMLP